MCVASHFFSCPLPPSVSLSLSVSHSHSVPHVIGEWAHVAPISHVGDSLLVCLSVHYFHPLLFSLNSLMHFHELSSSFFMAALKGLLPEGNGDEERHAGWFPSATYLQVMGLRKSDPREFIMRITNPPVGCSTSSCGLQGVVEVCLWL